MATAPHPPGCAPALSMAGGNRDYYSISQAAKLLGVSRVSIRRRIRAGQLPVSRPGRRTTRIKRHDLERLLVEDRTGSPRAWGAASEGDASAASGREDGVPAAPLPDWGAVGACEHVVQFYDADDYLLDRVGEFIGVTLRMGEVGIAVATPAHRAGLEERLRAAGLDVDAARAEGRYVTLDAADTLASFMVDGMPEPARFVEVVGRVIARAGEGQRRVHIFGEMVALLAQQGNYAAAVRLEQLWNNAQQTHSFALLCAYPLECLAGVGRAEALADICAAHARVIPTESYTALPGADERLRAVAVWQQKARSLEAALAAEAAARRAAEEALRLRDEFLSIAAHELRTPITSLSGYAQLLLHRLARDGYLEPEQTRKALETVQAQAARLSRLVSHLLDISRLEAGRLALERHPADLTKVVEDVVAGARTWSERHTIAVTAPPSLEAWIDSVRLEQVLANLLDNAVRYSPAGGAVEVVLAHAGAGAAEVSVRDRGLGIPVEKREQLFECYYQAHADGHRGGMGLGLYISRQIVELHGGHMRAEFPPDGGTRFIVHLPTGLEEAADRMPAL